MLDRGSGSGRRSISGWYNAGMKSQDRPPAGVYAGSGSVQASCDASSAGVRIAFSGPFMLGELGPIIAWAVGITDAAGETLRES